VNCRDPIRHRPAAPLLAFGLALLLAGWEVLPAAFAGDAPTAKAALPALLPVSTGTNLAADGAEAEASAEALEARLAEARASLAALPPEAAAWTNAPPGIPAQDISLRRALYQRLVRLYEQQLTAITNLEALKNHKADLVRQAQSWSGFSEPRPYSVLLTDSLREDIQAERLKVSNGESALAVLDQLIEDNRQTLTQAEGKIRLLNDQLEGAQDPAARVRLSSQREQARLQSQVAGATAAALDIERRLDEERLAQSRVRLGLLQRQLLVAEAGADFTQADLEKALSLLDTEAQQNERDLAAAEARREAARRALDAARQELARWQGSADAGASALARAGDVVELRRTQTETADTCVAVLRVLLEADNVGRLMWEQRYAAHRSQNVETLRQAERGLEGFRHRVALWKDYYQQQLDVAASQVALQEARLGKVNLGSDLAPLARERLASLREREQALTRIVGRIQSAERLIQRWHEALLDTARELPFTSRVRNLFFTAHGFLNRLWTFELFTAQDTITVDGQPITGRRSVTVGKVTMAVLILLVGYWISGLVTRMVEPVIVKRLKIEPNQASLIRRWLRVILVISLVLFSLVSVKIPLTVFAFAGGALAIGLGFGMQNLLKNFVSGIIILFERPFRVGDVVEVGGQRGVVTGIGLRASVVQLFDSTEALIPNSTLLETSLTNWTYSNRKVRFSVPVGVAYGSDPRRVLQILGEAAERHGLVEKDPRPHTLLTDFGESTLNFELRFWVDVSKANAAQVSSDLRLMIASALAEHGISIDYPQRDIHLHARRPLEVQVVAPTDSPPAQRPPG
jgi:small-conductance mechanosensitive channel/Mg2+ and Co2+ transporter CorA